ncbi:MAG: cupredoxin domain-containing protein [Minisyncoccota bacterium]
MRNQKILTGLGVLVLAVAGVWYSQSVSSTSVPAPSDMSVKEPRTHVLSLVERVLDPNIVTVSQGDQVIIKVMSDENGEFHISGYEIENEVMIGEELSFSFVADKAGRYNFELHPKAEGVAVEYDTKTTKDASAAVEEDIVVGAFVVNPR